MARKFLYFIVICAVLVIAAMFALRLWSDRLTKIAFVPDAAFVEQAPLETNAYEDPAMWFARPGLGDELVRWQPAFAQAEGETEAAGEAEEPAEAEAPDEELPRFAVFFVHPTSFLERSQWNAPLDDPQSQSRARTHGIRPLRSRLGMGVARRSPHPLQSRLRAPRRTALERSQGARLVGRRDGPLDRTR